MASPKLPAAVFCLLLPSGILSSCSANWCLLNTRDSLQCPQRGPVTRSPAKFHGTPLGA